MDRPPLVVVMGVSGSGKTSVGSRIAKLLGVVFVDGDSLHSSANVAKMAAGIPLTDDDRWPWLGQVGQVLADANQSGLVVACSALKRSYRDEIRRHAPTALFVHLAGSREILQSRVERRQKHFMPATLLDSQLETLELLQTDEAGFQVEIGQPISKIANQVVALLSQRTL